LKHLVIQISALALGIALAGCSGGEANPQNGSGPTYYRDVKPVVDVKCTGCHVEGGIAPFALTTLEQVTAQKAAIQGAVESRTMPPWPASDACASYLGDRSLSADQIKTIGDWVTGGAPAGDPADEPVPITDTRTTLSRVDRTLKLPVAYTPQLAPDDYRCFLVDWPDTDTSYVTGVGVQPDQPSIVHHVIAYLAPPSSVAEYQALDDADASPGWTCFGGPGGKEGGTGWVGAWAPGVLGSDYPAGTGIEIPPGSKIVLQVHYNTSTAKAVPDQSSIVLKVDKSVDKKAVIMPWTDVNWVLAHKMDIPAHSMDAVQTYSADPSPYMAYIAPGVIQPGTPFTIYAAGLHMHTRGTRATTRIERAGGGEECMLDIGKWNFHWQGSYAFEEPKRVNPGDKLSLECHWNNPDATDLNWGEGTGDEMCLAIYYATQ